MRRLIETSSIVLLAALLLSTAACKRSDQKIELEATVEESHDLASMVHAADPRASMQLVKGFHEVEQNAWRWTMANFSVMLRPPVGAAQNGATLELKLAVPEPVIQKLKSVTLSATVEGVPLENETYTKPGDYVYQRDVPAKAFVGDAVSVDFSLDKAIPPGDVDQRELGIVVSSVGLKAK